MLPYLRSYCRDIKKAYHLKWSLMRRRKILVRFTSTNSAKLVKAQKLIDKIDWKIAFWNERMIVWDKDLKALSINISDVPMGKIDVPVHISWIGDFTHFCVGPNTTESALEWHWRNEHCDKSRLYKEYMYEC